MQREVLVCVGTYTEPIHYGGGRTLPGRGRGIHLLCLDPDTAELRALGQPTAARNPTYLAVHPDGRTLYAVNEVASCDGRECGALSAFAVDPRTETLRFLNRRPTLGSDPCHVCIDSYGRHALVSNYSGGSVCVLPIRPDGSLGDPVELRQHAGSGIHPHRQAGPHVHSVTLDPTGRFAFAADLGTDRVVVYGYDPVTGKLADHDPPGLDVAPGAGPRHMAMHPNGDYAYLINELASTVTALSWDSARGCFGEMQSVSTLPPGNTATGSAGGIQVSQQAAFLYCSNRGDDSIATFAIDVRSGSIRAAGHTSAGGSMPRSIALDASGRFLLVANQDSDNVVAFRIDPRTGLPLPAGRSVGVGSPACVTFLSSRQA